MTKEQLATKYKAIIDTIVATTGAYPEGNMTFNDLEVKCIRHLSDLGNIDFAFRHVYITTFDDPASLREMLKIFEEKTPSLVAGIDISKITAHILCIFFK